MAKQRQNSSSPNAKTISDVLIAQVKDAGINQGKLASFSSDGASVMTGKRNGVASRLRAGNKTLINVCTAFAIIWHWHVAMLITRFPTSRKQRKFYYRCARSLKTAAYPKAVLAVKQLSVSNRGKKKLRKKS